MTGAGDRKSLVRLIYFGVLAGLGYFLLIVGHPHTMFFGPILTILSMTPKPMVFPTLNSILLSVALIMGLMLLLSMLLTTFSDPGVIARGNLEKMTEEQIVEEAKKAGYNVDDYHHNAEAAKIDVSIDVDPEKASSQMTRELIEQTKDYKHFKLKLYT